MTAEEFRNGLDAVGLSQTDLMEAMKARGAEVSDTLISMWTGTGKHTRPISEEHAEVIRLIFKEQAVIRTRKALSILQAA